jgi:hypothetical protein
VSRRPRCRECNKPTGHGIHICDACRKNESLEATADAILRRDEDVMVQELRKHAEVLEAMYRDALAPRNDPAYLRRLEKVDKVREEIANHLGAVHLTRQANGHHWLSLAMTNPKNRSRAQELLRKLGEHFEVKMINNDSTE